MKRTGTKITFIHQDDQENAEKIYPVPLEEMIARLQSTEEPDSPKLFQDGADRWIWRLALCVHIIEPVEISKAQALQLLQEALNERARFVEYTRKKDYKWTADLEANRRVLEQSGRRIAYLMEFEQAIVD